jgi:folate-dependent phosphoribosylglycinamide formyltransferase PurN
VNRIVVLTSGSSSTLQTLIDNTTSGDLNVEIAAVIAERGDSPALTLAATAGIEVQSLGLDEVVADGGDRDGFDVELAGLVAAFRPDLIVVIGRTIRLGQGFLERFQGNVIKPHPAMPGAFPGPDAVSLAYEAFERGEIKRTGVTVHRVGPAAGNRPVVTMEPVPIFAGEPIEELEERIRLVEDNLIVAAVHLLLGDT